MRKGLHIPPTDWPDERQLIEEVTNQIEAALAERGGSHTEKEGGVPAELVKGLADIATHTWRARNKMIDTSTGEVREEMKRVYRHIEAIFQTIQDLEVEVKDHTGTRFDYGLPLKVVATQATEGLGTEMVVETIKPTVFWKNQMIQMGEVVVATPVAPKSNP